jgi:uncharacterized membrane protein (DUF4010 family)
VSDLASLQRLGIALAIGLLIGVERGWQARKVPEGQRVAGLRTFGLIGLLGGLSALLAQETAGIAVLPTAFVLLGVFLALGYHVTARKEGTRGATTEVAALLTFVLGAAAAFDHLLAASTAAVATVILLGTKDSLHGWVAGLEEREIHAALKLLLISVVVLPLLPRTAVDPWGVFVPFEIWWFVVLFAGLSFAGYVAVRAAGPNRGLGITAVLGGLVSSTATAISFARLARTQKQASTAFAAGILLASTIMPIRLVVLVAVVNPALVPAVAPPLVAMAVAGVLASLVLWLRRGRTETVEGVQFRNPVELWAAVKFGALLVAVIGLSHVLRHSFGDAGVYALASVSGLADVDAVTLSLSSLAKETLAPGVAAGGVVTAACVNGVAKAVFVAAIERRATARRVAIGTVAMVGAAVLAMLFREQLQLS